MTFRRNRSRIVLVVSASALRLVASAHAQPVDQEISTALGPSVPDALELWVDANPAENTATSVGTIQRCRRVVGSAGDTFTVDVVVYNAPSFNGFGLRVAYDDTAVVVTAVDLAQKLTSTGLFLPPFPLWGIVDPAGPIQWLDINAMAGCAPPAPCGCPQPAGTGVLARITFKIVDPSKQSGIDIHPGPGLVPFVTDACGAGPSFPVVSFGLSQVVLDAPAAPDRGCWTCNSVIDAADFDPGDGIADADPLLGIVLSTLGAAIVESNLHVGANRISFSTLPTPPTIVPAAPLLPLSDLSGGTTIDGSTQSGVTIDGTAAGGPGLKLLSSDNVIKLVDVINCGTVAGILITGTDADDNLVEGCRIGIDASDALAANLVGVLITGGASDNEIGSTSLGNVISGNIAEGVMITGPGTTGNKVRNNHIGTDIAGMSSVGNGTTGVSVNNAEGNFIGGPLNAHGNIISGNVAEGVLLIFAGAYENIVQNNWIGLDAAGGGMGNISDGALITLGAHDNLIGAEVGGVAGGPSISGNVISDNLGDGIRIAGVGSDANIIHGNIIGADPTGTLPLGNLGSGVVIINGPALNEVGGSVAGEGNLIADNLLRGVNINNAHNNNVQNNSIGVGVGGVGLGNNLDGVLVDAGGTDNSITGNTVFDNQDSVAIHDFGSSSNTITANFIGSVTLPNDFDGVYIFNGASGNLVSNNAIGNNTEDGIHLENAHGNLITANTILGNEEHGVHISDGSAANVIGGDIPIALNLISGNLIHGVHIDGGFANRIALNEITWSGLAGVAVLAGTGNSIRVNTILNNGPLVPSLGIDLGVPGVTANDADDFDIGANDLQNFPVLTSALDDGGIVTISGTLNSTPSTAFTIDFYGNGGCDSSGHGEANNYIGTTTVVTDRNGDSAFSFDAALAGGTTFTTATATNPGDPLLPDDGSTSEFSACVAVTSLVPCPADLDGSGAVNGLDLAMLLAAWTGAAAYAPCPPFAPADFNIDCHINGLDLALLLGAWGPCL